MKIYRILISVFLLIMPLFAGDYTADFLETGVGARALGMGRTFVAMADDQSALYWNPAGLRQLEGSQFLLMHSNLYKGLAHTNYLGFARNFGKYSLAAGYLRLSIDDIPLTRELDENGRPVIYKYSSDVEEAAYIGFATPVKKINGLDVGINTKILHQTVADHDAWGFGFDVGIFYNWNQSIRIGLQAYDITGTMLIWDTGNKDTRSPNLNLAGGYTFKINQFDSRLVILAGQEIGTPATGQDGWLGKKYSHNSNLGCEYQYRDFLTFRYGWNQENWSAGAGFRISKINFDYAFQPHDLDNSHRLSATYSW